MDRRQQLETLAEREGLRLEEDFTLGAYTPSLARVPALAASGRLAEGVEATIALPVRTDGEGSALGAPVVLVHLPGTIARLPELYCRDTAYRVTREYQLGIGGFERLDHETIFESVSVERRFAVEHPADTDPIYLRRLFAPTFLDWLGEHAPPDLHFELLSGRLTVILGEGGADLDLLWRSAATIATRLREEAAEDRSPGLEAPLAAPLPAPPLDPTARDAVARVRWERPPESVAEAAAAYARHARGGPGVQARALLLAGGLGAAVFLLGVVDLLLLGGIPSALALMAGGIVIFATIYPLAIRGPRARLAAEWGKLAFAEQFAAAEGLELEDPAALHERWPEMPLPGPVRRLWRGTSSRGRSFRLMLLHDPSGTPGRSGFEGLLIEGTGDAPEPAGEAVDQIRHGDLLVLVRPTPLPSPTATGLRQLRDSLERAGAG
jgi:hypothetical protein